jgi:hypothetical protein
MIAHFALMGELYQYDPYETEASLWNSYPWQIGRDNGLDFEAVIPAFTMTKTIWDIGGSDSSIGATGAELGDFSMFATLILMDNFGNLGSDVGNEPDPFPYTLIGTLTGSVISIQSEPSVVEANSNAETADEAPLIFAKSGSVLSASSQLTVVEANLNAETADEAPLIFAKSGSVLSITSTQV